MTLFGEVNEEETEDPRIKVTEASEKVSSSTMIIYKVKQDLRKNSFG